MIRAPVVALICAVLLPSATFVAAGAAASAPPAKRSMMTRVFGGTHIPFYGNGVAVRVSAFDLDRYPVSQAEFAQFVRAHPQWRRDRIGRAFADALYLSDWTDALHPGDDAAQRPVVNVSWFAAKAYCAAVGARLPSVLEWEYAASASERTRDATGNVAFRQRVLELTTHAADRIGSGFRNVYGVHDLHGVVREWNSDFNNVMVSDDSRGNDERDLFCAAGASRARDPSDYAAFLRYAFRAGLTGRSTVGNLGFRCARSS